MSAVQKKSVKKGSIALYAVLLLVAVVVMYMLRGYAKPQVTKIEDKKGELVVAVEYAPMFLYTYGDTLGGFSYDLLNLIAAQKGIKFNFQPMVTLSSSLDKLKAGDYRMVCAEFPVTKEHKQDYLFTTPIYLDRQVLVQMKNGEGHIAVKSQLDLANDTVWVVNGSSSELRLENLSSEIGDTIYVMTEKNYGAEQLFLRVVSGEIKQAVMNERVAQELSKKYPNVDITTGISMTQFQSWILNKNDSAFCDSINSWIDAVKHTQEYTNLYNRYFPE